MGLVRFGLAVSLDGYVAGPEQSLENPLGIGGMQLHEWAFRLDAWRREHGESGGESNPSSAVEKVLSREPLYNKVSGHSRRSARGLTPAFLS